MSSGQVQVRRDCRVSYLRVRRDRATVRAYGRSQHAPSGLR